MPEARELIKQYGRPCGGGFLICHLPTKPWYIIGDSELQLTQLVAKHLREQAATNMRNRILEGQ